MAARFGRNKRRAAREALQAAQAREGIALRAAEMANGLAAWHLEQRDKAETLLGEVRDRLLRACGSETALLPLDLQPKRKTAREPWAYKHPIRVDLDGFFASSATAIPFQLDSRPDHVDLMRLVATVEDHPSDFRTLIRFEDTTEAPRGFSTRATWVSKDALCRVGLMGSDRVRLVEDIVRGLIELPRRRSSDEAA